MSWLGMKGFVGIGFGTGRHDQKYEFYIAEDCFFELYRRQAEFSDATLTSIDLFAGCGGLTRGLEWSGFECLAFNELNKDAADSFAANFPMH